MLSFNKTKQKIILLSLVTLTFFLSVFSIHSHSTETKKTDVEINQGCEPIISGLMVIPTFKLTGKVLWGYAVGAAMSAKANAETLVCDNIEKFIESEVEGMSNFDTQLFLDENCQGEYGKCNDPLLDVNGCGVFDVCPQSPYDCEFNTLRCLNGMINFSDGYTVHEVINALIYMQTSFNQGYWHHNQSVDFNNSLTLK